jgi:uncharacterized protein (TIGR03437 family)
LFANAAWWNANVTVPMANLKYQDYLDQIVQRAKKYGNYVLIVKAGQFPDPPCGADGKNCPAPDQGDRNCKASAAACPAQDTSGAYTDTAFQFWSGFAKRYAGDPAVLYDTWEDMHGIDAGAWADAQNQIVAAIRTYNPRALIFVEDVPGAYEAIVSGQSPDLAWSNLVWSFHLFAGGTSPACPLAASPRYAAWPSNFDPLVEWARHHGRAVAITEWGGCSDGDPYRTQISSYAQAHQVPIVYFDAPDLIAGGQLTASGQKVQPVYSAMGVAGPGAVSVLLSASGAATLAPASIASAYGTGLATTSSVTVTDASGTARPATLYFASASQVNFVVPAGTATGAGTVTLASPSGILASGPARIDAVAPGLYSADGSGRGAAAALLLLYHPGGAYDSSYAFTCSAPGNCATAPLDLGGAGDQAVLLLFATGVRGRSGLGGVSCRIGSVSLPVQYAGPQGQYPGFDQINVLLPASMRGNGERDLTLAVDGQSSNTLRINLR